MWRHIKYSYITAANEVLGYKQGRKTAPWIFQQALHLSDERRLLKPVRHTNEANRRRYNGITREIKAKAKQCKEQWINDKCAEAEQSKNSGKLFWIINEICGKLSPKLINIKDKSGKLLDNTADIVRRWKEHFEELYNIQNPVDRSVLTQLPSATTDEMDNFLREEVVHQIRKLKTNKAPGFDNISAEMIKAGD